MNPPGRNGRDESRRKRQAREVMRAASLKDPMYTPSVAQSVDFGELWEGCRKSRRSSRDTYQESSITKYTSIRRQVVRAASLKDPVSEHCLRSLPHSVERETVLY